MGSWNKGNMQLKFSKKSLNKERASSFGGRGLKTLRTKMSPKISGFQYCHLVSSSLTAFWMVSWNDVSPVFSLTHSMPLLEKIEKAEDDPEAQSGRHDTDNREGVEPLTYISGLADIICD